MLLMCVQQFLRRFFIASVDLNPVCLFAYINFVVVITIALYFSVVLYRYQMKPT